MVISSKRKLSIWTVFPPWWEMGPEYYFLGLEFYPQPIFARMWSLTWACLFFWGGGGDKYGEGGLCALQHRGREALKDGHLRRTLSFLQYFDIWLKLQSHINLIWVCILFCFLNHFFKMKLFKETFGFTEVYNRILGLQLDVLQ